MQKYLEVLVDNKALIDKALTLVTAKINEAVATKERCTIALAGGNTPKPLYQALAQAKLPWEKIHVFWGDERYVRETDPLSNQKMAREVWLTPVNFPPDNIHPMPTSSGDPAKDAYNYQRDLLDHFQLSPGDLPVFDLILLGMGDDAHTASLFPQTEALTVNDRLITVGSKDGEPRLTFTVPLINAAACVIFLVTGANKQQALKQVFAPEADGMLYPTRLIQPQGELWWLLDQEAGANINSET
ncbi:6-phosphogluconolactonase [Gloeocapsa sp. PCC 73106]|uniref:6-phosphogluconolactonase n=1 Tax=Gloeocapsa sp. PCC 73106 TaxID=102232 RepID=UPI0002ABB42A|nr:6-phosphogluconolactonase [Gloeocapsa sp. PCC 73106]ELR97674.1 6-phosphogluconolactonase [Gloeocapsa sp. PCC 73106]